MKHILLFKKGNSVITFTDAKEMYAEEHNSDLPIDDTDLMMILMQDNRYQIIKDSDIYYKWCKEYVEAVDTRGLTLEELEESVKCIYEYLTADTVDCIFEKSLLSNLSDDEEDVRLKEAYYRLRKER